MSGPRIAARWTRATWAGWALGVPAIALFALAGEAVGIGGAQWLVGAGMGAGLGLMQARALRGIIDRPSAWFWSCVGALTAPFLAIDAANLAGRGALWSVYAAVGVAGLVAAVWQAAILRRRFDGAGLWTAASVVGWALAGGAVAVADLMQRERSLRGLAGALAFLGTVAVGGLLLGLVTGVALERIVGRRTAI
jgi:hypothetical protein